MTARPLLALPLILWLGACGALERKDQAGCRIPEDYEAITRTELRDGHFYYVARIDRHGSITWSGAVVDLPTFRSYAKQVASLRPDAGRLSLQVQQKAPCDTVVVVRQSMVAAGLCRQGRCAEAAWDFKGPIVY